MLPFCWLGRVTNGSLAHDALTIRIWLRDPITGLAPAVKKALPPPLKLALVDGRLACVTVANPKAALKASFGKAGSPKPATVPEIHAASTAQIVDGWSKATPLDRFFVNVESWLAIVHDHHPIAVATVDWWDWFAVHARPEPCAWHLRSLGELPDLSSLAGVIDDERTAASDARRELATAILYFASDHRPLYDRVAADEGLQQLYARAWTNDERGRTLQLLATAVSDDTLARVASHTGRLRALIHGRGFAAGDAWNVSTLATPGNAVWGVQERKRLFYLSRPMHPRVVFDEQRDAFIVTEPDWGIEEAGDVPSSTVALAAAFASRYGRLIERGESPASAEDETFVARARTDIARLLTGEVADYNFTWTDAPVSRRIA